jgi:single-strand DNA-binding protein
MFGERAQKIQQYITKGAQVTVTGNFVLEEWEREGVKNSMPCIIVNDIQLPPQQQGQQQSQGQWQQQQQQTNNMHNQNQQTPDFDDLPDW